MGTGINIDWTANLLEQLTWHWEGQLRPRFDGLTDAEYLWEPVEGAWSLRAAGTGRAAMAAGGGALLADFEFPEPTPAPVTTIAWRMAHLLVGVLGARNASHFGGPPVDYLTKVYPSTAAEALAELDVEYDRWTQGVAGLDASSLATPVGPAEGDFTAHPWAGLILHINRELIHHGAEIALLRDLYAHRRA